MNDDTVADLKQFITATITQQTADLATKDDLENLATKGDLSRVEQKVNQIQVAIDQSAIGYAAAIDEQVQEHEKRLGQLEQKAA